MTQLPRLQIVLVQHCISQPAIVGLLVAYVQAGRVALLYTVMLTLRWKYPPDIHATCMVLFKTRLDKRETSCCVHIVYYALSQQHAATYRNVPQRAASHTVEERAHHANFYIAFDINSNSWPKHVERRHSVYISRPSPFTHAGSARSREKKYF